MKGVFVDTAGWMASLVVMQELRLKQALTTDHHFRQMGFQVLPRSAA